LCLARLAAPEGDMPAIGAEHNPVDLSRIYAAPAARLGCLAFEGQGAFASQS
jgi:hypothetical protein